MKETERKMKTNRYILIYIASKLIAQSQKTKRVITAKKGNTISHSGMKTKDKTPKIKAKNEILTNPFFIEKVYFFVFDQQYSFSIHC